jgi:hypothetical protein
MKLRRNGSPQLWHSPSPAPSSSCHLILAQGRGEALNQVNPKGHDFMHIDAEYADFSCTECHAGGLQK